LELLKYKYVALFLQFLVNTIYQQQRSELILFN